MPRAPQGVCTWGGGVCRRKAEFGARCKKHRRGSEGNPLEEFYRSHVWRALAAQVRREEPVCRCSGACGRHQGPCTAQTTDVDHIVSMNDGGAALLRSNLQGLCEPCHEQKTWADRTRRAKAWA